MMRKLFTLALIVPAIFMACGDYDDSVITEKGEGSISFNPQLNLLVENQTTRATEPLTNFTGYKATLTGDYPYSLDVAADGTVGGIKGGTYDVTLSNMADFVPAFGDPRYSGTKTDVTVEADKTTPVSMTLTQANAGIFFVKHSSVIGTALENAIPTVTQGSDFLVFEEDNAESKGYFNPGQATITAELDGEPVAFANGSSERVLQLEAGQLWQVTFRVSTETGDLTLDIDIEVITDPNQFDDITLAPLPATMSNSVNCYYGNVGLGDRMTFTVSDFDYYTLSMDVVIPAVDHEAIDITSDKEHFTGTYTFSESGEPWTFGPGSYDNGTLSGSYVSKDVIIEGTRTPFERLVVIGGTMTIEYKSMEIWGGTYTVNHLQAVVTAQDTETGTTYTRAFEFTGMLWVDDERPGPDETYNFDPTAVEAEYYAEYVSPNATNMSLILKSIEGTYQQFISIDLYMEKTNGEIKLVPGTYDATEMTVTGQGMPWQFRKGVQNYSELYMSSFVIQNKYTETYEQVISCGPIIDGTIDISDAGGGDYTITWDLEGYNMDAKKARVFMAGTWTGTVDFHDMIGG